VAGDDLTISLFLCGLGATFGLEAVKAETFPRRGLFGVLAGIFLLTGIAWLQVKPLWPPFTTAVSAIATNPVSWFVVAMFALAIIAFQPRRPHVEPTPAPKPLPLPLVAAVPPSAAAVEPVPEPIKEAPREFINTTPEYLLGIRRQENLTRIQTDKLLSPYIGKWLKVTGTVTQIYDRITWIRIGPVVQGDTLSVLLVVNPTWKASFHLLELKQTISAIGRINEVSYSEIQLEDCELVID
jgi:hypothetical protein